MKNNNINDGNGKPDGIPRYSGTFKSAYKSSQLNKNKQFEWYGNIYDGTTGNVVGEEKNTSVITPNQLSTYKSNATTVATNNVIKANGGTPVKKKRVVLKPKQNNNTTYVNGILPNIKVPVQKVDNVFTKPKEFTTSPSFEKFKQINNTVTKYDLGSKGYSDSTKSDCSGAVCRYLGVDEQTANNSLNAYNIYVKHTKDNPENKIKYKDIKDGDGLYIYNPNGSNHIGVINVDKYGHKILSHVNGTSDGYGTNHYDEYVSKLEGLGYTMHPFRFNKNNNNDNK